MKQIVKRSVIAILALIGVLLMAGCESDVKPAEVLYGPPSMFEE